MLPYLVLVLIHMLSGMQMEQPIIVADEIGYLGNARYLSGTAHLPDMRESTFYHFGYSLILLPAFWLLTEPVSIYKTAIAINALVTSSLYFSLYFILKSFLDVPRSTARWIAFTCCLYPSLVLYSNFAWSENAFIPFYAATTALFGTYLASRSSRAALLFGLCAGFLYTIHPRALPVLAIILAVLLVLAFLKVLPNRQVLLSVTMIGVVFTLTRVVNDHLKATGWDGGGEFSPIKFAARLLPSSDFPALVDRALGQALYLTQASHGLFLVGLVAVIWLSLGTLASASPARVMANPRTGVPIFVLLTASGVFVASCTLKLYSIHGPVGVRGADLIHGRYNEAFAILFMAFGLAEYCRRRPTKRQLILAVTGVAVVTTCVTAVVAIEVADAHRRHDPGVLEQALVGGILPSDVDGVNVPGVFPLVGLFGGLKLYAMSLAALASFLMITVAMRFTRRGGMSLLALLFAVFALYNHRHYVLPAIAAARPRLTFVSQLSRIGPIKTISYDAAHHEPQVFFGAQFLLPHTVFTRYDSRNDEAPGSEAVISGHGWRQARRLGARFVVSSGWDNALWVLPGEMTSRLAAVSYEGVILGAEPSFGVQESGFYFPETFLGVPARWTDGAAVLNVPVDPANPAQMLEIKTIVPGREGARLQVLANGLALWNGEIPSDPWSKTLSLEQVPMYDVLLIELKSDTFSPAANNPDSADERSLGVMVREIRLTARNTQEAAAYEGLNLGVESILGFEESGFHLPERIQRVPGRWTNGAATLRVPLHPRNPPRWLEVETMAPGRDGARLRVLANGVELWNQPIPSVAWSKTFSLERVPMKDELHIELLSDTFSPTEKYLDSADERRLGVMVLGIRLTARDSFEGRSRRKNEFE